MKARLSGNVEQIDNDWGLRRPLEVGGLKSPLLGNKEGWKVQRRSQVDWYSWASITIEGKRDQLDRIGDVGNIGIETGALEGDVIDIHGGNLGVANGASGSTLCGARQGI